ncbi:ADP-ribosylglycohydrolase family protein [bacterium]|nr:ADP-ribosylglycohydrolase family protein [bacterium]
MDKDTLREKYLGCILGAAIGDTLGAPVERLSHDEIKKQYGKITDFIEDADHSPFWTDDTQMILDVAESYVEHSDCNPDDIAQRFVDWYEKGGRGIGFTTSRVLWFIKQGMKPLDASRMVWDESKQQLAGNGALMRCAPTALARLNDKDKIVSETRTVGEITHFDPRSTESCVFFNLFLSDIVQDIHHDLSDYLVTLTEQDVISTVESAASTDQDKLSKSGYVLDTLKVAMWAYANCVDFEDALITVVNLGGDTDTNGAVVGALFGGQYGISGIPSRWLEKLDQRERLEKAALGLLDKFIS